MAAARARVSPVTAADPVAFDVAGVVSAGDAAPWLEVRATGGAYDGRRRCNGKAVPEDGAVRVRFRPAADAVVDHALIAAPAVPGCFLFDALSVGGEAVADVARRVMAVDGELLPSAPGSLRVRNLRRAPRIELDLRGLQAGVVEVAIRRERDDGAARLAGSVVDVAAGLRALESEVAAARLSQGRRAEAVAGALGEVGARQAALASAVQEEAGVRRASEAGLDARAAAIESTLADLVAAVAAAGARQAAAEAGIGARLQAIDARDEARQAGFDAFDGRLEARLSRLEAADARADAKLDRIVDGIENVFWRRWLRRLRGGGR